MEIIATALMGIFLFPGLGTSINTSALISVPHTPVARPVKVVVKTPRLVVKVTSYNAVPDQTDDTPFITASGAYANFQIVAARSRDLAHSLPFGTIVAIEPPTNPSHTCGYNLVSSQVGYRVIADTMNIRKHNQVDVLLNQRHTVRVGRKAVNPSIALGICHGMVLRVVGHLNINRMPTTQAQLARIVKGDNVLALR